MEQLLICPGYIFSKYDGARHYISAEQLIQLYRIDTRIHQTATLSDGVVDGYWKEIHYVSWTKVYPLHDGNYEEVRKELNLGD